MDIRDRNIEFRVALLRDLDDCWRLINKARQQMIESGLHQWSEDYPSKNDILNDINDGFARVVTIDGKIAVYGAVILNGEPKYDFIKGKWQTMGNYYAIHRFATLPEMQREGYARTFLKYVRGLCEVELIPSIKLDTHVHNLKMVRLLSSMGFCYCGTIDYGSRGSRICFEQVTLTAADQESMRNNMK